MDYVNIFRKRTEKIKNFSEVSLPRKIREKG